MRYRGAGARADPGQAPGLAWVPDAPAQPAVRMMLAPDRCGSDGTWLQRGSAIGAGGLAGTKVRHHDGRVTAAAMLAWLLTERIRDGHGTSPGAASGIVVGSRPSHLLLLGERGRGAGHRCGRRSSVRWPSGYSSSSASTIPSTSSASTSSAAWSKPPMVGLVATPDARPQRSTACHGGGVDQLWRQAGSLRVLGLPAVVTAILAVLANTPLDCDSTVRLR